MNGGVERADVEEKEAIRAVRIESDGGEKFEGMVCIFDIRGKDTDNRLKYTVQEVINVLSGTGAGRDCGSAWRIGFVNFEKKINGRFT